MPVLGWKLPPNIVLTILVSKLARIEHWKFVKMKKIRSICYIQNWHVKWWKYWSIGKRISNNEKWLVGGEYRNCRASSSDISISAPEDAGRTIMNKTRQPQDWVNTLKVTHTTHGLNEIFSKGKCNCSRNSYCIRRTKNDLKWRGFWRKPLVLERKKCTSELVEGLKLRERTEVQLPVAGLPCTVPIGLTCAVAGVNSATKLGARKPCV